MVTDDEARRLLHQAGETVTVDPAAPIDEPGRRRVWPVLAAAAAVAALAVTTVLITAPGTHEDPTPAPPVTAEVQIPSLLGYDLNSAVDTLRDLGLEFRVETEPACNTDYVQGTVPAAGTPVAPGAEVVVRHVIPGQGFCIDEDQLAVDLLALADGRGAGPPLADDLEVYDATGATDLDTVLDRLSATAHAFYPSDSEGYVSPVLTGTHVPALLGYRGPPPRCRYASPSEATTFLEREFARVGVSQPPAREGADVPCAEFVLDVYRDKQGRVDVIVERSLGEGVAPEPDPEPTVGTAFRDFARGGDLPPIADEVDVYLGNAFTGFVTTASATDRQAWATCTELGEYAGRACPISPLDVLKQHRQVDYVDEPDSRCLQTYGPVPPDLRALERVVVVPAKGSVDSCIDDFAVQLFANADGELVAVSLLQGEP